MGNVNLPLPLALSAGALCLLGGYLVGVVTGPDAPERTTAEVVSFDGATDELCLAGDAVAELPGTKDHELCGTWRHNPGATTPSRGETFRFVTMTSKGVTADEVVTFIYGDVVR